MSLSEEQKSIIASAGNIKINAVAGSGKTTTVIEYAKTRPDKSLILYLAFNKSVKLEAEEKFRNNGLHNVKVETAHSLAYKHVVIGSRYKVRHMTYKTHEIAEILGLNGGGEKHAEFVLANHILKFISYFCNSDKERIKDLNYLEVLTDFNARDFVKSCYRYIEMQAEKLFQKMELAEIEVTHDFYLKKFQLTRPQLKYDYILFDEGQDASAAVLDVFLKQAGTKVIVGDTHQQIYGWRYAINSLEKVNFQTFHLSTSFRFGKDIAHLANRVLGWKNYFRAQENIVINGGGQTTGLKIKAIIARTNLGLLLEAISFITKKEHGTSIYFEGNINSYTYAEDGASLYDVLHLYNRKRGAIKDKIIRTMRNLDELEEYIEKTEDAQLGIMVEIVKEYGNAIPGLIRDLKSRHVQGDEKQKAEWIFSTVHRCKGMEYDEIYLAPDFITEKKVIDASKKLREENAKAKLLEEINLLYVALTRTKHLLHIHAKTLPEDFPASKTICVIKEEVSEDAKVGPVGDKLSNTALDPDSAILLEASPTKEKAYNVEKMRETYKGAYSPWTEALDKELETLMMNLSVKKLALHFGRTEGSIRSRIKKLEKTSLCK
ncbi:DNA helicase [Sphingobacteriaceae bacterium]|nr:DNA helicase [Sphingobacteriaceae bacterium]